MRLAISLLVLLTSAFPAAAVTLDLTSLGSSGSIGAATFATTDTQPTGTGVLMPFVRLQNNGIEQGFNTDATVGSGDLADVKAGTWTHSLLVGSINPVLYNGVLHLRFILDIDQQASNPLQSLDEVRVYTAPIPNISSLAVLSAQNLIYDMGAGNKVLLDYNLNNGSGSGDMFMYLPYSLFAGLNTQYLYLYSKLGASGPPYESNDGPTEWALLSGPLSVKPTTWGAIKEIFKSE